MNVRSFVSDFELFFGLLSCQFQYAQASLLLHRSHAMDWSDQSCAGSFQCDHSSDNVLGITAHKVWSANWIAADIQLKQ